MTVPHVTVCHLLKRLSKQVNSALRNNYSFFLVRVIKYNSERGGELTIDINVRESGGMKNVHFSCSLKAFFVNVN